MTYTPNERRAAAAPQKELPSCNPTDEDCDVAVDGLLEYMPLSSDGLRQVIACRERELRIALAAKEAAEKERDQAVFECSEYSTVNNWRTQQIASAVAVGVVFTEPGITCTNERAELAEKENDRVASQHKAQPEG